VPSGLIERDPSGASPAQTESGSSVGADGLPPCPYRELLTMLTHDLKNPLALIRGGTQLLDRRLSRPRPIGPAAVRAGLAQIEAASTRMNLLLDDLLDAVSFGAELAPVRPSRPVDLTTCEGAGTTVVVHLPTSARRYRWPTRSASCT
jgi:hypothetical protein